MDSRGKALAVIRSIRDLVNHGKVVQFEEDWGGNSMTVYIIDRANGTASHTHCGIDECPEKQLIDALHGAFCGGPGLSWHTDKIASEPEDTESQSGNQQ